MSPLEVVATTVSVVVALVSLAALWARVLFLPYLRDHLISPILDRLEKMHDKDGELEAAYRVASYMFEGHMTASADDRGHLWDAVAELRKDSHRHD